MNKKNFAWLATPLAIIFAFGFYNSPRLVANDHDRDRDDDRESLASIGLRIAPVPLKLKGKDIELVALGSYIVNAQSDCNGCHTPNPATEYTVSPYFGARNKKVNPATYLSGGQDFGSLIPGSADIMSRNLTPDKTGRPEGGRTYAEFERIMRTGFDFDHLHPTCPAGTNGPTCIPAPFDGALLQIMPWPQYQDMTDHDLRAIYEYLSTIPCLAGSPDPSSVLHNDCGK